jgi:hypothetical protein
MDELFLPISPFFAQVKEQPVMQLLANGKGFSSPISGELPVNIQLVTLEKLSVNQLLVRLAHQFAIGEDPLLSEEAQVDLTELLKAFSPVSCTELTLSANQLLSARELRRIHWKSESASIAALSMKDKRNALADKGRCVVLLQAMQIKTFIVQLD